jgi:hypothetical protein
MRGRAIGRKPICLCCPRIFIITDRIVSSIQPRLGPDFNIDARSPLNARSLHSPQWHLLCIGWVFRVKCRRAAGGRPLLVPTPTPSCPTPMQPTRSWSRRCGGRVSGWMAAACLLRADPPPPPHPHPPPPPPPSAHLHILTAGSHTQAPHTHNPIPPPPPLPHPRCPTPQLVRRAGERLEDNSVLVVKESLRLLQARLARIYFWRSVSAFFFVLGTIQPVLGLFGPLLA